MKESDIQSSIIDYLQFMENKGVLFFQRTNNIPVSQIRNGKRVFRSMAKGQKKGFPDITMVINGLFIALEVKMPKKYQSKDQKAMQAKIELAGGKYFVVRSVDEVIRIVKELRG